MKRTIIAAGIMLFGASAGTAQQDVALRQQALMKEQARSLYGVIARTVRGQSPYDQAAVDAALVQLEESVGKIAAVFTPNPKEDVVNADFGSSQKIWQNKADFDAKIPPVSQAIADAKGKITDVNTLKVAYDSINARCGGCHETYRVKLK